MAQIKQIAVSVCAEGESIVALTDDGRMFRMCNDGPWRELPLPWKQQAEVPFSECKNPDCPIGCPDSHCLDFPMEEVSRG